MAYICGFQQQMIEYEAHTLLGGESKNKTVAQIQRGHNIIFVQEVKPLSHFSIDRDIKCVAQKIS